jgi:negative regulator of sigma E activity
MAIASATISGVQGVQNAYSTAQKSPITTFFPAYPIVQSALAGAVALKNISAIKSVNPKGGGSSTVPTPSGGGGGISQPPAFNVVGASDTNQLADAIGSQSQEPTRAYVVSNDVTTAQSMDRNIVDGASI